MKRMFFVLLIGVFSVYGQQRIAILNTVDDEEPQLKPTELNYLTDRLRNIAGKILKDKYGIMTQESIVSRLGDVKTAAKVCNEATCLADLGRKLNANYVAQGRIGRFSGNYTIKVELYNSTSGLQVATITGKSKDVDGLLSIIDTEAPDMFKDMLPKGEQAQAAASASPNSLNDSRDGKTYKIVKIGTQTWMAENLNYNAKGSKCNGNQPENCEKYGRLYDWETAKKACPSGWHLPTKGEWETLTKFSGGRKAGTPLKARYNWNKQRSTISYSEPVPYGTDAFGFTALPGGFGSARGGFRLPGDSGAWWSSTESDGEPYFCSMDSESEDAILNNSYGRDSFFSVRCLK